ncbi:hypothetical protein AK88_05526 [Plasmodium fragile]|uniref:Uncharacterized protein n=1 Tax=Plasmodium fragile TaxID=5857 RepID=A0A0D9QDE4_PLAFR|nr:uncharacterized protein AK88_05526 [Plasmodium fragile]KJP84847.1 hypothetical protein AK88_05526 [Plasmodium fragile]
MPEKEAQNAQEHKNKGKKNKIKKTTKKKKHLNAKPPKLEDCETVTPDSLNHKSGFQNHRILESILLNFKPHGILYPKSINPRTLGS